MKRTLDLSIPTPCAEEWENFEPRAAGGFCSSCSKTVVDFTRMTDDQIIDFFKKAPAHVCGRLRADQLRSYTLAASVRINPGWGLFRAGMASLFLLLASKAASAQSVIAGQHMEMVQDTAGTKVGEFAIHRERFTVSGLVQDEQQEPLPGVNILLKGTEAGTITGADGRFTFPRKLDHGEVLIVSVIGYKTLEYTIPRNCRAVDISLQLPLLALPTSCMDVVVVGGISSYRQSRVQRWWAKIKSIF